MFRGDYHSDNDDDDDDDDDISGEDNIDSYGSDYNGQEEEQEESDEEQIDNSIYTEINPVLHQCLVDRSEMYISNDEQDQTTIHVIGLIGGHQITVSGAEQIETIDNQLHVSIHSPCTVLVYNEIFEKITPQITHLSLIGTRTLPILDFLPNMNQLIYLNLGWNGIYTVTRLSEKFPILKTLILDGNPLTLTNDSLRGLNQLEVLSISNTATNHLYPTLHALHHLPNLKNLCTDNQQSQVHPLIAPKQRYTWWRSSSIFKQPYYRYFFITKLPNLICLDKIDIDNQERELARKIVTSHFDEMSIPNRDTPPYLLERELSYQRSKTIDKQILNNLYSKNNCLSNPPKIQVQKIPFLPRQLEFNPIMVDTYLLGGRGGEINVYNNDKILFSQQWEFCNILGLCWVPNQPWHFFVGSDKGKIQLYNTKQNIDKSRYNPSDAFQWFSNLTSLHVNSTSQNLAVSGNVKTFHIYDINTSQLVSKFEDVHNDSINVLKFSNHSPNLLVTSSFDHSLKTWDTRVSNKIPIYKKEFNYRLLMALYSPDDKYILYSGMDNNVGQLHSQDGSDFFSFTTHKTKSQYNYTRSYYSNQGDNVIIGSCDENVIRIYDSRDGKLIRDIEIPHDISIDDRLEDNNVQSLRADPYHNYSFMVITTGIDSKLLKINWEDTDH